jgi:hypothetical protein
MPCLKKTAGTFKHRRNKTGHSHDKRAGAIFTILQSDKRWKHVSHIAPFTAHAAVTTMYASPAI